MYSKGVAQPLTVAAWTLGGNRGLPGRQLFCFDKCAKKKEPVVGFAAMAHVEFEGPLGSPLLPPPSTLLPFPFRNTVWAWHGTLHTGVHSSDGWLVKVPVARASPRYDRGPFMIVTHTTGTVSYRTNIAIAIDRAIPCPPNVVSPTVAQNAAE